MSSGHCQGDRIYHTCEGLVVLPRIQGLTPGHTFALCLPRLGINFLLYSGSHSSVEVLRRRLWRDETGPLTKGPGTVD